MTNHSAIARVIERIDELEETVADLHRKYMTLAGNSGSGPSGEPDDNPWSPATTDDDSDKKSWEGILLGEQLCEDPNLNGLRQQFLEDVIRGVKAARWLAGQLLLAQAATVDKMPGLLKHVGEAYYGWRPRTSIVEDPMEQALVKWLNLLAEEAGLPNSIQLVRPGERFDKSKHVAPRPGVEIVEVRGWVVLRDQNKVYTKASVSVK